MIRKLFSSKARVEIMKLFLFNPRNIYYQSQISALTHQPIRAVQRELERFENAGLIERSIQGKRVYYKANTKCNIFKELKSIFMKTVGIAEALKMHLVEEKDIRIAFIYGSYATGREDLASDIDLMVIGNISSRKLSAILAEQKKELGRELNYTVFLEAEFKQKVKKKNHFIKSLLNEEKIFIIGTRNELERIVRPR